MSTRQAETTAERRRILARTLAAPPLRPGIVERPALLRAVDALDGAG